MKRAAVIVLAHVAAFLAGAVVGAIAVIVIPWAMKDDDRDWTGPFVPDPFAQPYGETWR